MICWLANQGRRQAHLFLKETLMMLTEVEVFLARKKYHMKNDRNPIYGCDILNGKMDPYLRS